VDATNGKTNDAYKALKALLQATHSTQVVIANEMAKNIDWTYWTEVFNKTLEAQISLCHALEFFDPWNKNFAEIAENCKKLQTKINTNQEVTNARAKSDAIN
jgi:hypothetical protein